MCNNTCTYNDSSYAQLYAALVTNHPPSMHYVCTACTIRTVRTLRTDFSVKLAFVSRAGRNTSLVETMNVHQVLYETWQVRSGNFTYDEEGIW